VQVPGKAVDKFVLTTMRFVRDDDNISSRGKLGVRVALLLGKKLLDGRKDDAAGTSTSPVA